MLQVHLIVDVCSGLWLLLEDDVRSVYRDALEKAVEQAKMVRVCKGLEV